MDKAIQKKLLNIVKLNYQDIAEHYCETRKKQLLPRWAEIVKIAKETKAGNRILDVGCGNGRLLEAFDNKQINYLGVDSDEQLLNFARKLHPDNKFILGDILELDKIDQKDFDYIFCIAVLHHIPGKSLQTQALRQMKNKIKPGGKIIITVWNMWSRKWQKKKFRKLIFKFALLKLIGRNKMTFGDILCDWKNQQGEPVSRRYYHAFTKCGLKKIVGRAKLKIERIYKDEYNYYVILRS